MDALNEKEEAEHADINHPFEAETARIEADPSSNDHTEHLLQELADKETSVAWLGERYAEMRSPVAHRYHILDTTPSLPADPLMDVDAVLVPQGAPVGGADVTTSVVEVAPFSPPQADPVGEIAVVTPSAVDHTSEDDDADQSTDDAPAADTDVAEFPSPAVPDPKPPTSGGPAIVFPVKHFFDGHLDDVHVYQLPVVGIAPHRPLKPTTEEDVLLWLRLCRHDSALNWEGNTLVFRSRCALADARFQRPAGQFTWTLGAEVAHFSPF